MKKKLLSALFLITMVYSLGFSQSILKDISPTTGSSYPENFMKYQGKVYFGANNQLWTSDGTEDGTVMVKDVDFRGDEGYTVFNDLIFFHGEDENYSTLWQSDGTEAGTVMVKQICETDNAGVAFLTVLGETLIFKAGDGGAEFGKELWKSDGTADGTVMIKDIEPGTSGGELEKFTVSGNLVYFTADNSEFGMDLWRTDGTEAGTFSLDINPGTENSGPAFLTDLNGTLIFKAHEGINGKELWKSDGTTEGTVMVKNIDPDLADGSGLENIYVFKDKVYFQADDDIHNDELWVSDGTEAGTMMVKDISPGSSGSYVGEFFAFNDILYFEADDGVSGYELWRTDGTSDGTYLVKDINPGVNSSSINDFFKVKDKLFFMANDGTHGDELWRTDGTYNGTALVKDIVVGTGSLNFDYPRVVGNHLYFRGYDVTSGYEPWHANILNITNQPTSAYEVVEGTTQVFTVEALGEGTLTYRWQKDGVDLVDAPTKSFSGATTNELTITDVAASDQGEYTCVVSDEFYGDVKSNIAVLSYEAFVSVNQIADDIKIYPNPAQSTITISSTELNNNRLYINDMTGKVVLSKTISGQNNTIHVSSFSKGVYFITIEGENTIREKFIKQ